MPTTPCQHCAEPIPAGNRFCGMCGVPVADGPPTAATSLWSAPEATTAIHPAMTEPGPPVLFHPPAPTVSAAPPSGPSVLRRYRGPLWVGAIGTVLFLAGAATVSAILSAVQLDSGTGLLVDLFGPLVEDQVEGTIGVDVIDLGNPGSGTLTSAAFLAAVVAVIVTLVGLLMVIVACAWGASRALGGRGSGSVTIAAPPVPVQYERPSFTKPAAPTYTPQTPPDQPPPAGPPTFTSRR